MNSPLVIKLIKKSTRYTWCTSVQTKDIKETRAIGKINAKPFCMYHYLPSFGSNTVETTCIYHKTRAMQLLLHFDLQH